MVYKNVIDEIDEINDFLTEILINKRFLIFSKKNRYEKIK